LFVGNLAPGSGHAPVCLVEQRLHDLVEGCLRRVEDADPVLHRVDRVWHQLVEGGVVRIPIRANDSLEGGLADADVQPVDAGSVQIRGWAYSSLVTRVAKFGQCFSPSHEMNVPLPAVKMSASGYL
jgi:hypothetical protein